jgi:hypothetical protein
MAFLFSLAALGTLHEPATPAKDVEPSCVNTRQILPLR